MLNHLLDFATVFASTLLDVTPIVLLIAFFQLVVFKKSIPRLSEMILGVVFVILGLTFFLIGLEKALFPIGETMALQLSSPEFIGINDLEETHWTSYYWVYIFALLVGFSTTLAEPSLIAVAIKARDASGGNISVWGLRIVVAIGVGFSLALGTFRIVVGDPLHVYIISGYILVLLMTIFTPKQMIALAYDSGGVTTSTVTVPIVAALGLGLASTIPGRSPALDGFGLIAFANFFAILSVLLYAQTIMFLKRKRS
jgi:hypothetical protein